MRRHLPIVIKNTRMVTDLFHDCSKDVKPLDTVNIQCATKEALINYVLCIYAENNGYHSAISPTAGVSMHWLFSIVNVNSVYPATPKTTVLSWVKETLSGNRIPRRKFHRLRGCIPRQRALHASAIGACCARERGYKRTGGRGRRTI